MECKEHGEYVPLYASQCPSCFYADLARWGCD
jgi:hypothetical protein